MGPPPNQPPQISVSAVPQGPGLWKISGTVTDETPSGLIVNVSGPGFANTFTTTVAGGAYSIVVQTVGSGTVTVTVTDPGGLTGTASTTINN
jgi:hypothetical protein